MIFVLGASGSWVGAIIFFGLLLLIGGYIAMIAAMCVVGPFLALHNWAIGKPAYQRFARHIPGYMDWIERRRQSQREEHAEWKAARDKYLKLHPWNLMQPTAEDFIRRYDMKHPEPYDPDKNSREDDEG